MKWMKQFGIILLISFVGEILEKWIPLPIPASIYGIILLFLCLKLNIIPHEAVHETGKFLIEIMPLMFIPAAVGLLETWDVIAPACFRQSHTVCDSAKEKGCAGKPCLIF